MIYMNIERIEKLNKIFVYGTLMKKRANHDRYLKNTIYLGPAKLEGYALYDLGLYPGIKKKNGSEVLGELYDVDNETLKKIDMLEGEGFLYLRKKVEVRQLGGKKVEAFVYEYNRVVDEKKIIKYKDQPYKRKEKLVWYVSYGSNLVFERFRIYIEGGKHPVSKEKVYSGCNDKSLPLDDMPITIKRDMIFSHHSKNWDGSTIAYLTHSDGEAYGRAYLVTEKQYEEIWEEEGKGDNFYGKPVPFEDDIKGIPVRTFTSKTKHKKSKKPSDAYYDHVFRGLQETYPNLTDEEIEEYLRRCYTE